jgi:hypothetical protein
VNLCTALQGTEFWHLDFDVIVKPEPGWRGIQMISAIFEQFVAASPVTVMVRAMMERIFRAEKLDDSSLD